MNVCFTCGKELTPVWPGAQCQYVGAVAFEAQGNYGSALFDPLDPRISMLIQICDLCLVERKDRVTLVHTERPLPEVTYSAWDPGEPA